MMGGDCRVDEIAAEPAKTPKRPLFVGTSELAIANDIRNQNRRELPSLAPLAQTRQRSPEGLKPVRQLAPAR
jgi:hypothetical protein